MITQTVRKENMPLVSVVVPVYNVENYLNRGLDALLSQSYRELEIILVDDGSTDSSGIICDQYAKVDSRITVMHKLNGGVSSARNLGLEAASGDYIGFIDPDDWPAPELFSILCDTAIKCNAEISICGHYIHHEDMPAEVRSFPQLEGRLDMEAALTYFVSMEYYEGFLWNKLFASKLINRAENGCKLLFDPNIHITEDAVFVCKCIIAADGIAYNPEPLYHYIVRDGSLTRSFNMEKRATEKEGWKQVAEMLPSNISHMAMERYYTVAINTLRNAVMFGTEKEVCELKEITKPYIYEYWKSPGVKFRNKLRAAFITYFPYTSDKIWLLIKEKFHIRWK